MTRRVASARWLLLPLLLSLAIPAQAHDPGLSAADIRIEPNQLSAHLFFAQADILALADIPDLDKIAAEVLLVRVDGQELTPIQISIQKDDPSDFQFLLTYRLPQGGQLDVDSLLIPRLARGHRQYITLRDQHGGLIAERVLEAHSSQLHADLLASAGSEETKSPWTQFLRLGMEHILTGYDHLLFLFGLLIVGGGFRAAMTVITAFTVGHSFSLAAATLDLVHFASKPVEAMIAASIVYVGLENIFRRELKFRWVLALSFGLVHGLGFAAVLRELGIGHGRSAAVPLLSFNLGIELGQVAIAAVVLPLIWELHRFPGFKDLYVPRCSLLIALVGGFWFVRRTFFS